MISLIVVDSSAESRNRIIEDINACFTLDPSQIHFFPRLSITPLAPEELKFHTVPDICIIGPELLIQEISELGRIKRLLPNTAILVKSNGALESLSMVEHLARLGADDILSEKLPATELLRKIILHARSHSRTKTGRLIVVDSGKGGVGVTSFVAGLGELCAENNHRCCLIDMDFETQDLSRFLHVKPFVNDPLSEILGQNRAIFQESVEECLTQVWTDEDKLLVMTPPADCDELHDPTASLYRSMVSVLEILDSLFSIVVIDMACTRGILRKTLYRVADDIVFLSGNDPASLYTAANRIGGGFASMAPASKLWIVQNAASKQGLPTKLFFSELQRATRLENSCFIEEAIPYSKAASLWPGSGATLFSRGDRHISKAMKKVAARLSLFPDDTASEASASGIIAQIISRFKKKNTVPEAPPKALAISYDAQASESHEEKASLKALPQPQIQIEKTRNQITQQNTLTMPPTEAARSPRSLVSRAHVIQ